MKTINFKYTGTIALMLFAFFGANLMGQRSHRESSSRQNRTYSSTESSRRNHETRNRNDHKKETKHVEQNKHSKHNNHSFHKEYKHNDHYRYKGHSNKSHHAKHGHGEKQYYKKFRHSGRDYYYGSRGIYQYHPHHGYTLVRSHHQCRERLHGHYERRYINGQYYYYQHHEYYIKTPWGYLRVNQPSQQCKPHHDHHRSSDFVVNVRF